MKPFWNKNLANAGLLFLLTAPCLAATIAVNSLDDDIDDDGNCTLREAIIAANSNDPSGGAAGECAAGEAEPVVDEITFDGGAVGIISLTSPLPDIDEPVFVNGPGADQLAIDGSGLNSASSVQILDIRLGGSGSELSGLTFQNATTTSRSALNVRGATTVRDCVFQNNRANNGGAIRVLEDLTIEGSIFRRNTAVAFGGGAVALIDADRTLIVRDSLFEDNETLDRDGGAISVTGEGHATRISGSTFQGNDSAVDGGAISIGGATLSIENTTFIGNSALRNGGAIETGATSTVANVTITNNLADADSNNGGDGGGLSAISSSTQITVRNSIIAANMDGGTKFGFAPDCSGLFISDGHNLIGQVNVACGGFTNAVNGDQVGTAMNPIDPLLAALADNEGPTPTTALQAGSPAVAAGNPMGCAGADGIPLTVDQRGKPRPNPTGSACDIGAFELGSVQQFPLAVTITGSGGGQVSSTPSGINCPAIGCNADYFDGTVVTLTADANSSSIFTGWTGDCTGTGTCQVTMTEPGSVNAGFTAIEDEIFSSSFEN